MEGNRIVWIKRIITAIFACFFTLSLGRLLSMQGGSYPFYGVGLYGYSIWAVVALYLAAKLIYRLLNRGNGDVRLHVISGVLGMLLSTSVVWGTYVLFENDIFQSAKVVLLQAAMILGMLPAAMALSEEVILLLDRLPGYCEKKQDKPWAAEVFFQKHKALYFLMVWACIFAAYLPIFLCWWPGNFVYDASFQMVEVVTNSYTTSHPLLHTLLMGWAYKLGESMGDVSTGYQFYTLIQMLILAASFAYCVYYLYQKRVPRVFRIGALIWFSWFPMHAIFAISATKDVMFAGFFLSFSIYIIRLLHDREAFKWYDYTGFIVTGILCSLLRNNAIYAVMVGGLLLVLLEKGRKPKVQLLALLAVVYAVTMFINAGLVASVDAKDTISNKEKLSVPLQGLARVASYRRDELDDDLYDEICMYIREEDISCYNPYLSDEVKYYANEGMLRDNFVNFMKLWFKVGVQFPEEYLESIVSNNVGYWYLLDQAMFVSKPMEFYHKQIWIADEIEKRDYFPLAGKIYGELFWQETYREIPVLGYLFRMDGWVWFFHFYLAWCVYRKNQRAGLIGGISLVYLIGCYLGPVPILRYIYCIIVLFPLYLSMVMRHWEETCEGGAEA